MNCGGTASKGRAHALHVVGHGFTASPECHLETPQVLPGSGPHTTGCGPQTEIKQAQWPALILVMSLDFPLRSACPSSLREDHSTPSYMATGFAPQHLGTGFRMGSQLNWPKRISPGFLLSRVEERPVLFGVMVFVLRPQLRLASEL